MNLKQQISTLKKKKLKLEYNFIVDIFYLVNEFTRANIVHYSEGDFEFIGDNITEEINNDYKFITSTYNVSGADSREEVEALSRLDIIQVLNNKYEYIVKDDYKNLYGFETYLKKDVYLKEVPNHENYKDHIITSDKTHFYIPIIEQDKVYIMSDKKGTNAIKMTNKKWLTVKVKEQIQVINKYILKIWINRMPQNLLFPKLMIKCIQTTDYTEVRKVTALYPVLWDSYLECFKILKMLMVDKELHSSIDANEITLPQAKNNLLFFDPIVVSVDNNNNLNIINLYPFKKTLSWTEIRKYISKQTRKEQPLTYKQIKIDLIDSKMRNSSIHVSYQLMKRTMEDLTVNSPVDDINYTDIFKVSRYIYDNFNKLKDITVEDHDVIAETYCHANPFLFTRVEEKKEINDIENVAAIFKIEDDIYVYYNELLAERYREMRDLVISSLKRKILLLEKEHYKIFKRIGEASSYEPFIIDFKDIPEDNDVPIDMGDDDEDVEMSDTKKKNDDMEDIIVDDNDEEKKLLNFTPPENPPSNVYDFEFNTFSVPESRIKYIWNHEIVLIYMHIKILSRFTSRNFDPIDILEKMTETFKFYNKIYKTHFQEYEKTKTKIHFIEMEDKVKDLAIYNGEFYKNGRYKNWSFAISPVTIDTLEVFSQTLSSFYTKNVS